MNQIHFGFRLTNPSPPCKTFFSSSVLSLYIQNTGNETVDQERRRNNATTKMDIQPKTGTDGLRGVKAKIYHQRIGPKQKQKFRNTLERWLVKPSEKASTAEVCQTQEDEEMIDDSDFQSTSAQSLDCQNPVVPDSDEETQPLTPQDLDECLPVSLASKGKQDMEPSPSSAESVKHHTKITDFFLGTSFPGLPVRRGRPDKNSRGEDADKETASAVIKPDVKWLGTPISELKRIPGCFHPPALKDVPGLHTVMIRVWVTLFI